MRSVRFSIPSLDAVECFVVQLGRSVPHLSDQPPDLREPLPYVSGDLAAACTFRRGSALT
jgi:hypothetical protein